MLNEERAAESIDLVQSSIPFLLAGCRVLEIGCGVGTTQLVARRRGVQAIGIEPGFLGARAGQRLFSDSGKHAPISCAVGEALPFPGQSFDVVCSFQVLEHTSRPDLVLSETLRVLKPSGYFVHVFPNYGSFWEGHYGVPWIPHLPKTLARLYLRFLGRNLAMLNELQLLSHQGIERILDQRADVRIEGWGFTLWERRLRTLEFSEWAYLSRLKYGVVWLHRLRLVGLMVAVGRRLGFETPIVLVGRKLPPRGRP